MADSAPERMESAHLILERRGTVPAGLLAPDIYDSWMRCIALGLNTQRPPPIHRVSASTLRQEQQRHALIRGLALAEMHTLHQQIAGSNYMIAFATPGGTLLDIVSDQSFDDTADAAAIRPGCVWTEDLCGTNGLGTAAFLKRPITVEGGEHFFSRYRSLTCTASPVFGPDGKLAGVLDASSDCLSRQTHTQALVAMAATQIENGLFREQHRADVIIAFHNRGEYLHTLSAGLLAVDPAGRVLAVNRAANMLLLGLPAMPGRNFSDIFRTRFDDFLDDGRRQERQRLQDEVGSSFVATIGHSRPVAMAQAAGKLRVATNAPDLKRAAPTGFVSADRGVAALVHQAELAALRKMPILIRGETGTGKEQLARYAHAASRRPGAFVPVNCAALPETLIEAELFGYADGSFTGARKGGSAGLFREADGGTLFLDEIGDMPVTLQAVLLRFLDDWTVRPIGGTKRVIDILLVSATNANLDESIARGRFRSDLLFRLNTLEVTLPPLRDRADFGAVARHLLALIDPNRQLSDRAVARLAAFDWPGNIRELRNVLSRLTLDLGDDMIDEDAIEAISTMPCRQRVAGTLHDFQRARIAATYSETGDNVSETARRLGISRNTVYRALGLGKAATKDDLHS
ncbi:sigma-54-dependent Fis family transcriptional regulator [Lichenifustis flavocetrariae]|uniref:Sigma-54-dependent Fis family transcriptional regulator n=1 Tax=Lichenifustis flavocetrariae TaxID=2949735 RepID=A0AA42CK59_9HYPH|nr:sigma-54-dependent Fis family transcriptional regulator [Lichenifustis flavocetrariae]MCW6508866.1 sigma-54-dependent Fis family transcriptional regulator [Lichenifustis flavocetrariae]